MKLGIVTYQIAAKWDIETIIKNCAQTKFSGVELRTTHAHKVEPDLPKDRREEVRKRFADSPVRLVSLGSICEYQSPESAELKRNIELTKEFIVLAHDVGAEAVKVRPNGLPKDVEPKRTLEQIGRALKECGDRGRDFGVKVRMEVHGGGTSRIDNVVQILAACGDHPYVEIVWNSNQSDLEGGTLAQNFDRVKSRIGMVHLRDLYLEEYPWRELLCRLRDSGFQGTCCAEIPESPDPIRVLHYFRALYLSHIAAPAPAGGAH